MGIVLLSYVLKSHPELPSACFPKSRSLQYTLLCVPIIGVSQCSSCPNSCSGPHLSHSVTILRSSSLQGISSSYNNFSWSSWSLALLCWAWLCWAWTPRQEIKPTQPAINSTSISLPWWGYILSATLVKFLMVLGSSCHTCNRHTPHMHTALQACTSHAHTAWRETPRHTFLCACASASHSLKPWYCSVVRPTLHTGPSL